MLGQKRTHIAPLCDFLPLILKLTRVGIVFALIEKETLVSVFFKLK